MGAIISAFRCIPVAATLVMALVLPACGSGGGDPQTYTVTARAVTGGSITPANATARHGATTSFTVTPDTGYIIDSVTGCGGTLAGDTYTTGEITADCAVTASFSLNTYTVTAGAGTGGSITPASRVVRHGTNASFNVTPDAGYIIDSVTGCGGTLAGDTYVTGEITADCSVNASFGLGLQWSPVSVKRFRFTWTDVADASEYRLMENPDGASGYTRVATIAAGVESHELEVFLPARINAGYILSACNAGGCTDSAPLFISGSLAEAVGYAKASNAEAYDSFGFPLALSDDGNTLAVGGHLEDSSATGINGEEDNNTAYSSGTVYLFTRSGGAWSQQAYVKASNTEAGDLFGCVLALSGDGGTLAVGAYGEGSNATGIGGIQSDNSASRSGAVYLFTRSNNNWSQQAYVKASNTEAGDGFGRALALSGDGDTLAVAADGEDSNATGIGGIQSDNSASDGGAVYLFTRSDGTWSQQAYVKASNTGAGDGFGYAVALSDNGGTLAVGAPFEDSNATGIGGIQSDNSALRSGAVYLFTRSGGTWSQQAYVKASNTEAEDWFGYALALSGDGSTLAVAADGEDSNATGIGGIQSDNSALNSGAVYLFTRSGSDWSQRAYVKASNAGPGDFFGRAVALSGDGGALAVGAPYEDSNATGIGGVQSDNSALRSGAVYLFTRSGSDWSQQAYVKASNTEAEDWFGYALALSGDSNTLAVGAYGEDSNATGIGGNKSDNSASGSGAVYLY